MQDWVPSKKHQSTPDWIFENCRNHDRVRRILSGRCFNCGQVISGDEEKKQPILTKCDNESCDCQKSVVGKMHFGCDVCVAIFRSLYVNFGMENMNYFRNIDEQDKRERDDFNRGKKDRLGL